MHFESPVQHGCAGSPSSLYFYFLNQPAQAHLADLTEWLLVSHKALGRRVCECE